MGGGQGTEARDGAGSAARRGVAIHGALDIAFAALYAAVAFVLAPSRHRSFGIVVAGLVGLLLASGVSLLLRLRFARGLALATQALLLAACLLAIALLVASAAYLRGVYGPLGQAAAAICAIVAALLVEAGGLLPLFQIRLLLRPDVRRLLAGPGPGPGPGARPGV